MESLPSDGSFAAPKSLVQSVLEATAMRENEQELRAVSEMDIVENFGPFRPIPSFF